MHPSAGGRPRSYCRRSCRQRAYESRAAARRVGLDDDTMVVAKEEFERLTDLRFLVSSAVDDFERSDGDEPALRFLVASLRDALTKS